MIDAIKGLAEEVRFWRYWLGLRRHEWDRWTGCMHMVGDHSRWTCFWYSAKVNTEINQWIRELEGARR